MTLCKIVWYSQIFTYPLLIPIRHGWNQAASYLFNTLRPRQNGRHFPDDIFKCIFVNENAWISIKISLKFVPKAHINNIPALVQIMAWRRAGDKPLSEPMMVSLLTHICVRIYASLGLNELTCKKLETRVCAQHCGCWCSDAEAPGHQYPECWGNIHCIGLVLCKKYRTSILGNKIIFWKGKKV